MNKDVLHICSSGNILQNEMEWLQLSQHPLANSKNLYFYIYSTAGISTLRARKSCKYPLFIIVIHKERFCSKYLHIWNDECRNSLIVGIVILMLHGSWRRAATPGPNHIQKWSQRRRYFLYDFSELQHHGFISYMREIELFSSGMAHAASQSFVHQKMTCCMFVDHMCYIMV